MVSIASAGLARDLSTVFGLSFEVDVPDAVSRCGSLHGSKPSSLRSASVQLSAAMSHVSSIRAGVARTTRSDAFTALNRRTPAISWLCLAVSASSSQSRTSSTQSGLRVSANFSARQAVAPSGPRSLWPSRHSLGICSPLALSPAGVGLGVVESTKRKRLALDVFDGRDLTSEEARRNQKVVFCFAEHHAAERAVHALRFSNICFSTKDQYSPASSSFIHFAASGPSLSAWHRETPSTSRSTRTSS